jgi:putative phosphoesterase
LRAAPVKLLGLISDTHDLILHAGDVGGPEVLEALRGIAPVAAVRGNNDRGAWARTLPASRTLYVGSVRVHLRHDLKGVDIDRERSPIRLVVSGHSHRASVHEENGVTFVNPGSAGPRRFALPVSVARCNVTHDGVQARLVQLPIPRIRRVDPKVAASVSRVR